MLSDVNNTLKSRCDLETFVNDDDGGVGAVGGAMMQNYNHDHQHPPVEDTERALGMFIELANRRGDV